MGRNITIEGIAGQAGVSRQTVSRVINNHEDVAYETRIRVQEIIDRLGYKPNALARGLSAKRSRTIGVISSRLQYYGPRSMLTSLDINAHLAGYRIIPSILHEDDSPSEIENHLRNLIALQPDGIIWEVAVRIGNEFSIEGAQNLASIPMITMNKSLQGVHNVLEIDDTEASRTAVEHLIHQGYRNIGILTGPSDWYSTKRRLAGWKIALQEHGISSSSERIVEGDWTAASGRQGVEILLQQFPDVDAIFACNDQMALGILHELNKRGMRVPQEIGVVGYDDVDEAAYYTPALTTVNQPYDRYGKELLNIMLKMIDDNVRNREYAVPDPIYITPELVIRESSQRDLG